MAPASFHEQDTSWKHTFLIAEESSSLNARSAPWDADDERTRSGRHVLARKPTAVLHARPRTASVLAAIILRLSEFPVQPVTPHSHEQRVPGTCCDMPAWWARAAIVLVCVSTASAPCTAFSLSPGATLLPSHAAKHVTPKGMHGGSLTKSPSGTQHVRGLCSPRAARPLLTTRAVALGPGTETRQGDYGEITDLIASGVVAVWRKADAPPEALAGGARGSGHNITTARKHVEPDEIFVIGTSHLSEQSAAEVERLIRHVRPDNVVVELCRSRAGTPSSPIDPVSHPS